MDHDVRAGNQIPQAVILAERTPDRLDALGLQGRIGAAQQSLDPPVGGQETGHEGAAYEAGRAGQGDDAGHVAGGRKSAEGCLVCGRHEPGIAVRNPRDRRILGERA